MRRILPRLWQRVFLYSLVLVLFSSAMGVLLLRNNLMDKISALAFAFTAELRDALENQPPDGADAFLLKINRRQAKFWLEDEKGDLIAGQRFAERVGGDWSGHLRAEQRSGDVTLWQTTLAEPLFLATTPCTLQGQNAILYASYVTFATPPLETILSPSIITVTLITGLLALWMAHKVCKPLRRLRDEVSYISGTMRLRTIKVSGEDEIADVARAVNRLVDGLRRHVSGMSRLVLNISHELRSPITRMALSAEMIGEGLTLFRRRAGADAGKDETALSLAEKNYEALLLELEHMDKLIGNTLLSSKLDVQDPGELNDRTDLSRLCVKAAERYEAVFRQAGIRFMHSIEPGLESIGDDTLLMQVLSNLLDNAVKYGCGREHRVRLVLRSVKGQAELSVESSNDIPLPEEVLERLFEPYFRHEQKTGTGVGLGLALVRKIMALHSGSIRAENVEHGLLFVARLPLLKNRKTMRAEENAPR